MNKITIHGRLTRDPETREAGQAQVCKFTIAENQRFNRDKSNFHECEAWNKTGEFVERYFTKGSEILVVGELQQREYEAKDGAKRKVWSVNVDQVDFCGKASDRPGSVQGQRPAADVSGSGFYPVDISVEDEDLPF